MFPEYSPTGQRTFVYNSTGNGERPERMIQWQLALSWSPKPCSFSTKGAGSLMLDCGNYRSWIMMHWLQVKAGAQSFPLGPHWQLHKWSPSIMGRGMRNDKALVSGWFSFLFITRKMIHQGESPGRGACCAVLAHKKSQSDKLLTNLVTSYCFLPMEASAPTSILLFNTPEWNSHFPLGSSFIQAGSGEHGWLSGGNSAGLPPMIFFSS